MSRRVWSCALSAVTVLTSLTAAPAGGATPTQADAGRQVATPMSVGQAAADVAAAGLIGTAEVGPATFHGGQFPTTFEEAGQPVHLLAKRRRIPGLHQGWVDQFAGRKCRINACARPAPAPGPAVPPPATPSPTGAAQDVLNRVNEERRKVGAPPLTLDPCLSNVSAQPWADEMARSNNMRHQDMATVFKQCPPLRMVGENVAYGYKDPAAVMNGWMNSTGHRNNILLRDFNIMGVGIARSANGTLYWCQVFGRR